MAYLDDQGNPQGDPGAQGAPSQASSGANTNSTDFGNEALNWVASLMRQAWGREPTLQEVSQWGTNLDANYRNSIAQQIQSTPEAQDYQKKQGQPTAPNNSTTPNQPSQDWSKADYSDWNTVKAYAQSRGVTMSDQTAQYWAGKYNSPEFNGDRNYFFSRLSTDPAFGSGGGPGYTDPWGGQYTPPNYVKPPDFQAPDPSQVLNDPAIKLQMQESLKALQRSALSRGTLLTGGTATDIDKMAQQVASAGYDKLYQRAVGEDQMKYARNLDEYGIARDNALAQYSDKKGTFYDNQDRPFQKWMQTAGLGMNALSQANAQNGNYVNGFNNALGQGTQYSNGQYTDAAAARGAGRVGASNAWANAFGQSANAFGNLYGRYMNGNQNSMYQMQRGNPGNPNMYYPPY